MGSGYHGYRYSLVVMSVLCFGYASGQGQCTKIDSCTCSMDGGAGEINLHDLDAGGGNAKFTDLFAADNWYYSFNPCSSFNKGSCSGAAACQSNFDGSESYTIATADTADFGFDGVNVYLAYTGPGDGSGNVRLTTVDLVCDPNAEDPFIVANGESLPLYYSFTLTTKCACPGVCAGRIGPSGAGEEGISAGSVLCIIFISVMAVYIVSGVVFNKVKRQAEGKEIIPNVEFWSALPGLIKEGCMFVYGKARPSKTYDSI